MGLDSSWAEWKKFNQQNQRDKPKWRVVCWKYLKLSFTTVWPQCAHVIFKCMHLSSEHDILPVDHAGTRSHGCLKQMAVNMKKLLQTLLFLRSAGLEASRKTAGGTWGVPLGSCPLPLLVGTGAALQPQPPSLPGHGDITAGCLQIHVWIDLVSRRLTGHFLLIANPSQYI